MSLFDWVERNPVFYFFCASLILIYIYGICWTVVIIYTIYLLEKAFKDTENEEILGKTLLNVRRNNNQQNISYSKKVSSGFRMFPSYKKCEKKPTLESLIHQRKSKGNAGRHERQPLVAVVKNNMQIHLSNMDLEKRKPIYQCMRSPASPSMATNQLRGIPSPSSTKSNGNHFGPCNGSPLLNRSNLNMSVSNSVISPLNDSLEVHGSYFINRSVLHSPCSESINHSCFSPQNVPLFHKTNCSTESVVEALQQKSKRKRATQEQSDESNMKKKKIDIDSTLNDLLATTHTLPSVELNQISKRKNVKEVVSTGVQCLIHDEPSSRKKKKVQTENETSKRKYGLTQGQINELSDKTTKTSEEINIDKKEEGEQNREEAIKDMSLKRPIKNIQFDSSIKSVVSFSEITPHKKEQDSIIQKSNLKLSALKNMESPYKKLFDNGSAKNITPGSIKKMRKHPVYFTAKINIDEIQQHREEFGESGVSLKAFRLDQEEAIKRVNNVFEDNDVDVDFKSQPVSQISLLSSSTFGTSTVASIASDVPSNLVIPSQTSTALSVKSNLSGIFGSIASSAVVSTSTLSFGTSGSSISFAPSVVVSKANTEIASIAITGFQQTLPSSSVPSLVTPSAFNFGTVPSVNLPASIMPGSTCIGTVVVTTQSTTASINTMSQIIPTPANFNITFSTNNGSTLSSNAQPSLQFASLQKPTTTIPDSNKVTFSIGVKANIQTAAVVSSSMISSMPSTTPFNFSFQPQPQPLQTANSFLPTYQNITVSATKINVQPTVAFGVNMSTSQPLSFGTTTVASVTKPMFISVASSAVPFSPAVMSANVSTVPNVLSAVPSLPSSGNIFGQVPVCNPTTMTTTIQASIFGNSSTTTKTTQSSVFGSAGSGAQPGIFKQTTATQGIGSNIFAPQNISNGFSFAAATAPSTGFNFGASLPQNNPVSSAIGFNIPNTSVAQSNIFGKATPPSTNVQVPQNIFGARLPAVTSSQALFGAPTISMPTTQSIFERPVPSVPSTQSMFGNTPQNTFGANSQNTFGTASNVFGAVQQPSMFGNQSKISSAFNFTSTAISTAPSGGFSFGTTTTKSAFGNSNNVFGGSTATNNGVFDIAKPVGNPFGEQVKPSTGFDFSGSLSQGPAINFGSAAAPATNVFPTQQQPNEMPKPSFNFGSSQPATPTFGVTPASPAFGNIPQPSFASPQPFGTPNLNSSTGGGFTIGSGTSNPPPTRQTQRARRRLRR